MGWLGCGAVLGWLPPVMGTIVGGPSSGAVEGAASMESVRESGGSVGIIMW